MLAANALRRLAQPRVARAAARALPRAAPYRQGVALLHATSPPAEGTFHHVKDPENSAETPFEFDAEAEKEIAFTMAKYPDTQQGRQSGIMPLLWIVQAQLDKAHGTIKGESARGAIDFPRSQGGGGWVPLAAMHKVRAGRLAHSYRWPPSRPLRHRVRLETYPQP